MTSFGARCALRLAGCAQGRRAGAPSVLVSGRKVRAMCYND